MSLSQLLAQREAEESRTIQAGGPGSDRHKGSGPTDKNGESRELNSGPRNYGGALPKFDTHKEAEEWAGGRGYHYQLNGRKHQADSGSFYVSQGS